MCQFLNIRSHSEPGALYFSLGSYGIPSITNCVFKNCTSVASNGAIFISAESFNLIASCIDNCESFSKCHALQGCTNPLGKLFFNETMIKSSTNRYYDRGQSAITIYSGRNVFVDINSTSNYCYRGSAALSLVFPTLAFVHYSMLAYNNGPSLVSLSYCERPLEVLSSIILKNNVSTLFHLPNVVAGFTNCIIINNTFTIFLENASSPALIGCAVDFEIPFGISKTFIYSNPKKLPSIFYHNVFEGDCKIVNYKSPLPTATPLPTSTPKPTPTARPTPEPTPWPTPSPVPTISAKPTPAMTPSPSPLPSPVATPAMTPEPTREDKRRPIHNWDDPDDFVSKDDDDGPRIPDVRPERDQDDDDDENENRETKRANIPGKFDDNEDEDEDTDNNDEWNDANRPKIGPDGKPIKQQEKQKESKKNVRKDDVDDDDDDEQENKNWADSSKGKEPRVSKDDDDDDEDEKPRKRPAIKEK
ncbi:hypothetical protein TVAG_254220 [Trichomonas vaginalis G3]|uniref:Uncharacterized protein n=1 Tax=Trichomonas vaginalis (strain ATCC PRA-98 / G3) TaxID=412133 RepID=A2DMT9_TRIV3|nr:hypothetical protein TVAGG3_0059110 [Trichomonas vaginalis G3]EAY18310.1 hypothetical protein TVAG_254220 [Trichomonas vaginalis G3]KAI5541867.1 hypothetical protein TVAGG3_0059110 [Trichomonas vaginalis G3]|eukprot:XP_001579296.1 hypothetical protein [Trichomonas vaginalis G3]